MEFLDEDARPRFVFQSRRLQSTPENPETPQKSLSKLFIFVTVSLSSIFLLLSVLFLEAEPLKSILVWLSLSLLLGPFAPPPITGGDIRVGRGPILEPIDEEPEIAPEKQAPKKRSKPIRSEETVANPIPIVETGNGLTNRGKKSELSASGENGLVEESEWNEEDVEILKKQMVKNPVGKPRRWEVIAAGFNGRHRVESVIKMAKELGERKSDDHDSYARFLKNRKPLDARIQEEETINGESGQANNINGGSDDGVSWSSGEDIALLNALKTFPKEVAMRWEKIAAAVPGKTKAACVKRTAELKRDYRSSKAGPEK